jgi:DNA-binding GntR family transcriptional regulator
VTRLSPKEVRERVTLRATLEVIAAQSASPRMGIDEFAELEYRLKMLETAVASDQYYEAAQADLGFHRYIWQCSGNGTLCQLSRLSPLCGAGVRSKSVKPSRKVLPVRIATFCVTATRQRSHLRSGF